MNGGDPDGTDPNGTDPGAPAGTAVNGTTDHVEVVRGGRLSDAEVAALTVALTPSGADAPPATIPPWRLAGLYEGVGGATALDAPDLAHLTRRR